MKVARISFGEYKSESALDKFIKEMTRDFWDLSKTRKLQRLLGQVLPLS